MGLIADLKELVIAAKERDPAAVSTAEIILTYAGIQAVLNHRITHWLYKHKIPFFPRAISQISRFYTGIEIHPGAEIGRKLFIDHGMGVIIGAGAVVINDVPGDCTVVGVPGRIVKIKGEKVLSDEFHQMHLPDPVSEILNTCSLRIENLEKELDELKERKN